MGTPNFWKGNSSKTYAVLMSETIENEETGEDEVYYPDQMDCDFLKDNLEGKLEKLPYKLYNGGTLQEDNRSYGATPWFHIQSSKTFGDTEVLVNLTIKIVSAYYDGATLDWELGFGNNNSEVLEYGIEDDFFYSDMNEGLQKIQKKNAEKWAEKESDKMVKDVENIFEELSTPLRRVAVFSNGEAIYELSENKEK